MPRPRSDDPKPATLRVRRHRDRAKANLVPVTIGGEGFNVSAETAKRFKSRAEAETEVREKRDAER